MKTYAIANMKFVDINALDDAIVTSDTKQSFSYLTLFKEKTVSKDYATLGLNQFLLDGSKQIPNVVNDVAYMSESKSKTDCTFDVNPTLEINFDENHSSAGLTLCFGFDYATEVKITWYSLSNSKIIEKTFYPDAVEYSCNTQVSNYGKIVIEFIKTRLPEQYIQLQYIDYGISLEWSNDLIISAKIVEEVNTVSDTISNNTADITIIDEKNDFDIQNENGAWSSVQRTQEVSLSEYKDGVIIPCGKYYIDKFDFKDNKATFNMIDAIGLMDSYTYYNGDIYTDVKAGVILEDIFKTANVKYTIDTEAYNTRMTGWLGVQTCKQAMQMICFSLGMIADDCRREDIHIYKPTKEILSNIGKDRKIVGNTRVSLDDYVSGVSIECNNYSLSSELNTIYDNSLPTGTHRIVFDKPYKKDSITCVGGTIAEVKTNYIDVTMSADGNCKISGYPYESSTFEYKKTIDVIDAGNTDNVKKFGTCTLYNANNLPSVADYVLQYYKLRKKVDLKYYLDEEYAGNWVNIEDYSNYMSTTLVESQTIDLSGGFISTASCRGYTLVVIPQYYCGSEIYCGEELI